MTTTLGEIGLAYCGIRGRLTALLTGLDDRTANRPVTACPGWTIRDVLAHLSGTVADALAGRLGGFATDPWTARQIDERKGWTVEEILAEWNANGPSFDAVLDTVGDMGRAAVADGVNHEHDVRGALGIPGERDSDAVRIGLRFSAMSLIDSAKQRGVSLRIEATDGSTYGDSDGDVVLEGEPFELLRAATGRRSIDQLRQLQWRGDHEAVLPAFSWLTLSPATTSIHE